MTKKQAIAYVRGCAENEGPDGDEGLLTELFTALYGRPPEQDDWDDDVWSLCCAAVD